MPFLHDPLSDGFTLDVAGTGQPILLLHGGGGPATVAPLRTRLSRTMCVLTPTHPGWNGTPRPDRIDSVRALTSMYLAFLEREDLRNVIVVGSSLGGWLALDMAVNDDAGRISGVILLNSVGVDVPGEPIRDVFSLEPREMFNFSFHDPAPMLAGLANITPEELAVRRSNMQTLRIIAGTEQSDASLRARLVDLHRPTLVIWGESDRIVTPAYGRALASAIPGAKYVAIPRAGHLPQLEQPAATFAAIDDFLVSQSAIFR